MDAALLHPKGTPMANECSTSSWQQAMGKKMQKKFNSAVGESLFGRKRLLLLSTVLAGLMTLSFVTPAAAIDSQATPTGEIV